MLQDGLTPPDLDFAENADDNGLINIINVPSADSKSSLLKSFRNHLQIGIDYFI